MKLRLVKKELVPPVMEQERESSSHPAERDIQLTPPLGESVPIKYFAMHVAEERDHTTAFIIKCPTIDSDQLLSTYSISTSCYLLVSRKGSNIFLFESSSNFFLDFKNSHLFIVKRDLIGNQNGNLLKLIVGNINESVQKTFSIFNNMLYYVML